MALSAAKSGFSLEDLTRMGPSEIERKRKIAEALLAQSQGIHPIANPLEGMAQMAQALIGNLKGARLDRAEREGKAGANSLFSAGMGMGEYPAAPGGGGAAATGAPVNPNAYREGIAKIESGGNYQAIGPVTRGDKPYGKYQVMGANVGPWTEQALGKRMSPQEFLASPEAQDAVFDHIFGGYVKQYGQEGAAQAWFGGPNSIGKTGRKDVLGTSVGEYGKRFVASLGGGGAPAPAQVASLDPAAGLPAPAPAAPTGAIPAAYSKIPEKDSMGLTNQRAKFMEWNPDPVGNEEKNLGSINPDLARVVRRAKEIAGVPFVVGSGKRDEAMQAKAVKWGWSKTSDSDHLGGNATDLWPLDEDGAVVFDPGRQAKIAAAMKQAASELGVQIDAGADWKHPDRPHFGIKGGGTQVASLDPAAGLPQTAPVPQSQQAALGQALVADPAAVAAVQPGGGVPPPVAPGVPPAQVPIPAPAAGAPVAPVGQGAPPAGQVQLAQALTGGQPDIGLSMGATPHQPGEGPDLRTLMGMAGNEFMNPQQQKLIEALTGQRMQQADPAHQLDMKMKQAQLDALQGKKQKNWQKLDDNTLFDPDSGETKEIGPSGGPTKFEGTGLDAQAWNILQSADPSSKEYATAYSIVSQPKTQLVQTENGMMPVEVPPQLPGWLKAPGDTGAGGAAPAAGALGAAAAADGAAPGNVIAGTKKPKTEAQGRNSTITTILEGEIPTLNDNWGALADPKGQLLDKLPGGLGNMWQSEEFQRAAYSVNAGATNILYSLSGASSNPGEVLKQGQLLMPQFGDKPGAIADKLNRFKTYVKGVAIQSGDPELVATVNSALEKLTGKPTPKSATPAAADTPAADDTPPASYTGKYWKYLSPEQRKLWQ